MRVTHTYTYTVTGRMYFPVDMLRYDCCYPADGNSAAVIARTFDKTTMGEYRDVTVTSHRTPTVERWSSFGWAVSNVRKEAA